MDSEKFKNWALGGSTIGLLITLIITIVVTIPGYLAPIKSNAEFLPSIKEDTTFLRGRNQALIEARKGGRLRALDQFTTIDVKPNVVSEDILLEYAPIPKLPVGFPQGIKPVGYNFVLTPYTLTGLQTSISPLKPPAEVSIPYENLGLDPTVVRDILLQSWNEKDGKWTAIKTVKKGQTLHAQITEFTLFGLALPSSEASGKP